MRAEHQKANSDKSSGGVKYENVLLKRLKNDKTLKIKKINKQKKFYYKEKTPAEELAEKVYEKMEGDTYSEQLLEEVATTYIQSQKGKVIRGENKFFKRADITFDTEYKYFINEKLRNIHIIIDTTTSARGDRLKAKAQDCKVYKSLQLNTLYIIVLPNDDYFAVNGYDKPEYEIKQCKNAIYDNNFDNSYSDEGVDLIVQEDNLIDFLKYISKRKENNIEELVANWKKSAYNDMYNKKNVELENYKCKLIDIARPFIDKMIKEAKSH